ncbi:nucleotide exchange factor GrpE [Enemella sp. A6]|uniref:nucleotide exchange factor GrpE n=1 Tax=Enemella sp. A6 TaxID=3440152 RepID=UPI003EBF05BE
MTDSQETNEPQGPTVHDRRRIDPDTFQARAPQGAPAEPAAAEADTPAGDAPAAEAPAEGSPREAELAKELSERTLDLQRLQAEYVNYKRRVDRDRDVARQNGIESVLMDMLPILDDLQSAREHEELTGGFKAVADEIEQTAAKYGLTAYGAKGDPFDPTIHEALFHSYVEGLEGPTCVDVLQVGYMWKERRLRTAKVAVGEPPAGGEAAE